MCQYTPPAYRWVCGVFVEGRGGWEGEGEGAPGWGSCMYPYTPAEAWPTYRWVLVVVGGTRVIRCGSCMCQYTLQRVEQQAGPDSTPVDAHVHIYTTLRVTRPTYAHNRHVTTSAHTHAHTLLSPIAPAPPCLPPGPV